MAAFYTDTAARDAARLARAKTQGIARQMGVTITTRFDGAWHEIIVTAPDGKRFVFCDLHEIVIANAGPTSDGLWERAFIELEHEDTIVCGDDCEWCNEEPETE